MVLFLYIIVILYSEMSNFETTITLCKRFNDETQFSTSSDLKV